MARLATPCTIVHSSEDEAEKMPKPRPEVFQFSGSFKSLDGLDSPTKSMLGAKLFGRSDESSPVTTLISRCALLCKVAKPLR